MLTTLTQLSDESETLQHEPLKQALKTLNSCNGQDLSRDTNDNISKQQQQLVEQVELIKQVEQNVEEVDETIGNGDISNVEQDIEDLTNGKPLPQHEKYQVFGLEFEMPIRWTSVFFITLWHCIAVYNLLTYPLLTKIPLGLYATVVGGMSGFGITGGAHRFFTHKSFKAKTPLKLILLLCYSMAGQNTIYEWVRDHRVHHKFSETDADPHNAKRGFFFSHVGWLMMKKLPEVIKKGRSLDLSDLTDDPIVAFHMKYWIWFKLFFCFILPSSIPPLLWGESWYYSITTISFIRYVITLNSTWAVNSFAHLYGNRPYDHKIYPVENLAVSFFAMGEGYHNYHHTFPWDYRAAELGQMLNVTTLWLNFFEKIGWAYDLKAPSSDLVRKVIQNHGDGSHYKWGHEIPETVSHGKSRKDQ